MEHVAWNHLTDEQKVQLAKFYPQLSKENKEEEEKENEQD